MVSVGKCLAEFHTVFDCKRHEKFEMNSIADTELLLLRKKLINEEVEEVFDESKVKTRKKFLKNLLMWLLSALVWLIPTVGTLILLLSVFTILICLSLMMMASRYVGQMAKLLSQKIINRQI